MLHWIKIIYYSNVNESRAQNCKTCHNKILTEVLKKGQFIRVQCTEILNGNLKSGYSLVHVEDIGRGREVF